MRNMKRQSPFFTSFLLVDNHRAQVVDINQIRNVYLNYLEEDANVELVSNAY
jgi:hypothetical protein